MQMYRKNSRSSDKKYKTGQVVLLFAPTVTLRPERTAIVPISVRGGPQLQK